MRLYIAGKFSEKPLIKSYIDQAIKLGHTITHDWTEHNIETNLKDSAIRDIKAVQEADCLIIILSDAKYAYRGTFTELGCALGLEKKVIIISYNGFDAYYRTNCFYEHPSIQHVTTWDAAMKLLD